MVIQPTINWRGILYQLRRANAGATIVEVAEQIGAPAFASEEFSVRRPANEPARAWLAASYEQLGFQAESGAWRSYFLSGARELRLGTPSGGGPLSRSPEFLAAVATADLFDDLAARYAPEKLGRAPFALNVELTDSGERVMVQVGAATAVPRVGAHSARAAATLRIARADLDRLLFGKISLEGLLDEGAMRIEGDAGSVRAWLGALDRPAHWFNVVVP